MRKKNTKIAIQKNFRINYISLKGAGKAGRDDEKKVLFLWVND